MKKYLYIALLIMGNMVYAQTEFGWSAAKWGITYNSTNNNLIREMELLQFNFLILDKININVSGLNVQFKEDEIIDIVILPLELGIVPWAIHWQDACFFPLVIYGKGSWLFSNNGDNSFYGSAGIRTSLFFRFEDSNYVIPLAAFLEYTTASELRVGIAVDLLIIGLIFGNLI